jgi:hypothetical protein
MRTAHAPRRQQLEKATDMSNDQQASRTDVSAKTNPFTSFDAAFIGGSLAIGAMLFVMLMTVKDVFPIMH